MPFSIRSRLLLLVLSVLLPAAAAAVWMILQTYADERTMLERNLRDTTRALSLVVDRELTQRAAIARVLPLSTALDSAPALSDAQLATFTMQARRAMQGLGGWVELRLPDGRVFDTQPGPGGRPTWIDNPAGASLVEEPRVGPLQIGGPDGSMHATLLQPVQRGGRTVMNVAVTILPSELQRIVDDQQFPPDWVGAVLDNVGTVVARHPGGVSHAGRSATPDMKENLARAREGLFESNTLDGMPAAGFYRTATQGWTFLTALPRPMLAGGLPTTVVQVVLGALALLGLAVAGAMWVSRGISGPVYSLKAAAARMQAGQPVERRATGIVECDEVSAAMAEAGEAMRHARADLERQVSEAVARTREAEQRVSRSQRVEALGRLTGGVAHDFNNLLGVISNSAHLIQRQVATPAIDVPIGAMLRAVDVGSRLTQHLLRFAGRQPVRPQAMDLRRYLPEVQELIKTVLGKRIEVTVAVAPDTRRITVDSSELELALINLALNARDAMPGGGHLWLQARNAEADDGASPEGRPFVMITVTDDGSGIDEAVADRVFEPFFTTKPVGKGTGLGLSQVHGFCVQAGGKARLASTPGLGTTISLLLPASDHESEHATPAPPPLDPAALAGRRVLLVEDNEELGDTTQALLGGFGATVTRARSPFEALRRIEEEAAFDVVLSDVVMPGGMDGVALARTLRERLPSLPVVLISGFSTALAGATDFTALHKPCTPEDLVNTLQRAMAASAEPPGIAGHTDLAADARPEPPRP